MTGRKPEEPPEDGIPGGLSSGRSSGLPRGGLPRGLDLTETYVFLGGDGSASAVPLTEALWDEVAGQTGTRGTHLAHSHLAAHTELHGEGWFVSAYWMEADMATWERHPIGDRLVIAQTGAFTLILDHQDGNREHIALQAVGSALVPRNCWHRLTVQQPGMVLFITPSRGMEHRLA